MKVGIEGGEPIETAVIRQQNQFFIFSSSDPPSSA